MNLWNRALKIANFPATCAFFVAIFVSSIPFIHKTPFDLTGSILFLVCIALAVAAMGRLLSFGPSAIAEDEMSRSGYFLMLGILVLAGAALRIPLLESIPPGIFVDEAFQGLQAVSFWSGEVIPDIPEHHNPPEWPIWWVLTGISTWLLGPTITAARLPAAIVGTSTLVVAWFCGRAFFGRAGGVVSALFVCGSFWHLQYSRLIFEPILLVAEGLVVFWLVLAPGRAGSIIALGAAGFISGLAVYGYATALYLPLWGMAAVFLGTLRSGNGRRALAGSSVYLLCLLLSVLPLMSPRRMAAHFDRPRQLVADAHRLDLHGMLVPVVNMFHHVQAGFGQWVNHPAGSPRFSVFERALLLVGLAGLFALQKIPRHVRVAVGLWTLISLLPEMVNGELHLSRGLGFIAPAAILAGAAGHVVYSRFGRPGFLTIMGIGLINIASTGHHLFVRFPHDPYVKTWYLSMDRQAAEEIRKMSMARSISMSADQLSYEKSPVLRFHLWQEIRENRILVVPESRRMLLTPLFIRHPVTGEPYTFIETAPDWPTDRLVGVGEITSILSQGLELERQGKYGEAEAFYGNLISIFPDSYQTHLHLARLYRRTGKLRESEREYLEVKKGGYVFDR